MWYNKKYDWRIVLDFNSNHWFEPNPLWTETLKFMRANQLNFKSRWDYVKTIFTDDHRVLDYILNEPELQQYVSAVSYTSDKYSDALGVKEDISTDVKFVRRVPSHPYLLEIGGVYKKGPQVRHAITEHIIRNKKNFVFKGYNNEVINRCEIHPGYHGVFDGFQFYAQNPDDILMLHLVAPGHIKKVIQLVEKGKVVK